MSGEQTPDSMGSRLWLVVAALSTVVLATNAVAVLVWAVNPFDVVTSLGGIAFAVMGALVVRRRPENTIGRLLVAMGVVWTLGQVSDNYLSLAGAVPLPKLDVVAWLNAWAFQPMLVLAAFTIALFPSGRVVTSWMRWPLRAGIAVGVLAVSANMVLPVPAEEQPFGDEFASNPWAVESLSPLTPLTEVLTYCYIAILVVAVIDLTLRWRKTTGVERLQMRSLAFGLAVFVVELMAALIAESAGVEGLANDVLWTLAWVVPGLAALPIAIGVAVIRYRLYDIDRIISRTVSYALVITTLALVYTGGVFVFRRVIPLDGDLAVAGSTLVAAALFNPLRRRVQNRVDRRFNRSRYDAERVAEAFAGSLRDQTESPAVVNGLVDVVEKTLQPSSLSIWIHEPAHRAQ